MNGAAAPMLFLQAKEASMSAKRAPRTALAAALISVAPMLAAPALAQPSSPPSASGGKIEGSVKPSDKPRKPTSEHEKRGGDFGPGGVPHKGQATTQPSSGPSRAGSSDTTRATGDYGPGGVPRTRGAATKTPPRGGAESPGAPEAGKSQ
jgi:hypothetical protein